MRYLGTVTTFFSSRRFGFITSDADGISRFVHQTNSVDPLELGMRVEFEIGKPTKIGKGDQCVKVTLAQESGAVGAA